MLDLITENLLTMEINHLMEKIFCENIILYLYLLFMLLYNKINQDAYTIAVTYIQTHSFLRVIFQRTIHYLIARTHNFVAFY